ncbi:hypothetical protein D3C75_571730 [compost metagenome]
MAIEQFTCRTEVADVSHARTDKHFVDFLALNIRQQTCIVRIVWRTQNWLFDIVQINFDDLCVFRIGIGFQQLRIRQPFFHALNTALKRTTIAVTFCDRPLQQHNVRAQVFFDRLAIQLNGTAGSRTFSGSIGQLKRLLDFQRWQAFDFQDATREDVFLTFHLNGQQALFNGIQRDRVNQVAQSNPRLHFAFEAHQHRFRHIQWHHASCRSKRNQTRARREGNPDRETGVGVTARTDGIRQQHTVQPGVDNTIARTQRDAATVHDEVRQCVVSIHIHRLRISGSVAEGLHHQVSREAQAREVFQLITGHWTGGVLRTDRRHFWFAVLVRANAVHATGAANHFLRQREAASTGDNIFRLHENFAAWQIQRFTCFSRKTATDDQRNTATGTNFVQQHVSFQLEVCDNVVGFVVTHFAFVWIDINDIAHVQVVYVNFDWQRTGIFHGVEEDWRNFAAEHHTAAALVRHVRDVIAHEPQHGVSRRFTRRTGTHYVAHISQRETFFV